jgi:hypothetical protein
VTTRENVSAAQQLALDRRHFDVVGREFAIEVLP